MLARPRWKLLTLVHVVIGVLTLVPGCSPVEADQVGKRIDYEEPKRPTLAQRGKQQNADGTYTVAKLQNLELRYDPSRFSPHLAAAQCLRWLMECREPPARSLDDCFATVSVCPEDPAAEHPTRVCCPEECRAEYSRLRRAKKPDMEAIRQVMPGCFDRAWSDAMVPP